MVTNCERPGFSSIVEKISLGVISILLICSCIFETEAPPNALDSIRIQPDLSIGNQWMYRYLRFTEYQDGSQSDSTGFFIHYEITGDTMIAGIKYRVLVEEDLALINLDFGLVKYRSTYVVQADSTGVKIKALKGGDRSNGRFPFKMSSGANSISGNAVFDTTHFKDEIMVVKSPVNSGQGWIFREPGSPFGYLSATKTFIGRDTLLLADEKVPAFKFQVEAENAKDVRAYEWYADAFKIFSRSSSSTTFGGKDSSRAEEEYFGRRSFTREDTLAVLNGVNSGSLPE
jgi:hypothetical protein